MACWQFTLVLLVVMQAFTEQQTLNLQNQHRADHHVPALTFDASLAAHAYLCARFMVKHNSNPQIHPCNPGAKSQGENIYTISHNNAGDGILDVAEQSWYNEVKYIDFSNPHWYMILNTNDPNKPVGHFTQMVWRDTNKVGCGYASGPTVTHVVCRYNPAGNTFTASKLRDNVKAISSSSSCADQDGCNFMQCDGAFAAMAREMCPKKCGVC